MKRFLIALCCSLSLSAFAEPLAVSQSDTLQTVLTSQQGKRVTVKLASGEELTGQVAQVNGAVVYLQELTGREFFDALINIDDIQAVIVRAK